MKVKKNLSKYDKNIWQKNTHKDLSENPPRGRQKGSAPFNVSQPYKKCIYDFAVFIPKPKRRF